MSSILDRDTFNCFVRETHAELAGAASGPLAGLTFGAKDIYDVEGHRCTFGSPTWLATHAPAKDTAVAVRQLVAAGATLAGKTQTAELTYSLNGENVHYGSVLNPNAPGRDTGGSSSGSAAATAAGLVDFALGSDTGGSVRLPASFCGVYGMRPSHGRVSLEGACPLGPSFDTAGWFARDAALFEKIGRVLLGDDAPAAVPGRLLLAADAFQRAGRTVGDALQGAVAKVESVLGKAEPVTVAAEGLDDWGMNVFRVIQAHEAWQSLGAWITEHKPALGPGIKERFQWASTVDRAMLLGAASKREEVSRRMDRMLAGNAVLVLPASPGIAPKIGAPAAEIDDFRARALAILSIAGLARLPQVSLPMATLDGCPLGISLIAARGNDTLLLELAKTLEHQIR
ncbi:MAG: amidase [Rhodocyclaceae bacterium]|nr:amidase [Rhodocyclaceae bacterium]